MSAPQALPSGFWWGALVNLSGSTAGAGHGMLFPAFNALAGNRLGPGARGTAMAVVNSAVNFGGAVGNPAIGLIAQGAGYRVMYMVVAAGAVMMAMGFDGLERRGRALAALWLLLGLAGAACAQRVAVLSDIEGSALKLERFLSRHPAFVTDSRGQRHVAPDAYFVHGGDWDFSNGSQGGLNTCVMLFPINVEAAVVINSSGKATGTEFSQGGYQCRVLKWAFETAWVAQ